MYINIRVQLILEIENRSGPSIDPCGTPYLIDLVCE